MKIFFDNAEKVHGQGPSQYDRNEKEKHEEKHYVESAVNAIRSGSLLQSALKNCNEKKFVPGGRASHKAHKDACSSVQGTTRDIKKTD